MADKKIIAVVGATGAQGGGLVRAIAADPASGFTVRALTRHPDSEKAKALKAMGAEVVGADVDDPDSMKRAFNGAYGAYCVTFFWDHLSAEKEIAEAGLMARAAKEARVQHVIWSTLEDTRNFLPITDTRMPVLQDKYNVPHFDGKGEADHIFTMLGIPTTFLRTCAYWDNFIYFGMGPKKIGENTYAITMPMGNEKYVGIASEDIGKCAFAIFKKGKEMIGQTVSIAGEQLTGAEIAAVFTKELGRTVVYNDVPPDVYRGFGFPGAEELGNMFQIDRDFAKELTRAHDVGLTRALNPSLLTFDAWVRQNRDRIPLD